MSTRRPGMDNPYYAYAPMPARPRLSWPNGARVAFWVLLHLEYWELDPPKEAVRDPRFVSEFGNFFPDYRSWSQREYGNRVGIFRILEVLGPLRHQGDGRRRLGRVRALSRPHRRVLKARLRVRRPRQPRDPPHHRAG